MSTNISFSFLVFYFMLQFYTFWHLHWKMKKKRWRKRGFKWKSFWRGEAKNWRIRILFDHHSVSFTNFAYCSSDSEILIKKKYLNAFTFYSTAVQFANLFILFLISKSNRVTHPPVLHCFVKDLNVTEEFLGRQLTSQNNSWWDVGIRFCEVNENCLPTIRICYDDEKPEDMFFFFFEPLGIFLFILSLWALVWSLISGNKYFTDNSKLKNLILIFYIIALGIQRVRVRKMKCSTHIEMQTKISSLINEQNGI